ncbi:MAG: TonB family protein [Sphingomonas sp.]|nr:MAG: TonB family protein [Sphingomonas sp.]
MTPDDYPPEAMRDLVSGTTAMKLAITPEGTVRDCTVTSRSGSDLLDSTACRLLAERGRFKPAFDRRGRAVIGTYPIRIKWKIPTTAEEMSYPTLTSMDAKVTFIVNQDGLVEDCQELSLEGVAADAHYCAQATSRSRFQPPVDATGTPARKRVTVHNVVTVEDASSPAR